MAVSVANSTRATAPVQFRNPGRPWVVRFGKKLRFAINRALVGQSLVGDSPILNASSFPWLRELERAAPLIQNEVDRLLEHLDAIPPMNEMSPDHQRIAGAGGWRSFFLIGYGYRLEANCRRCPATMEALASVPGVVTALISILEPGMHVGRHRGVSKGILIAHLGLRVPKQANRCRMDVDGEEVIWRGGQTFVFDDTYPHEVWNDTAERRVILLIQFRRPMRLVGRILAGLFVWAVKLSPYIQDARRNVDYWEERLSRSEARLR